MAQYHFVVVVDQYVVFSKNIVSLGISQNDLVSNSPQSMIPTEDVKLSCQKKRPIIRLQFGYAE